MESAWNKTAGEGDVLVLLPRRTRLDMRGVLGAMRRAGQLRRRIWHVGLGQHAPCALLPYPLPADLFTHAVALAKPFNAMLDRVSRDIPWLTKTVRTLLLNDALQSCECNDHG